MLPSNENKESKEAAGFCWQTDGPTRSRVNWD